MILRETNRMFSSSYSVRELFGGIMMGEHYEEPMLRSQRKKKLRIGRVIFSFLLLSVIILSTYILIQYQMGKSAAEGNTINPGLFEGDGIDPNHPSTENFLLLGIDDDGGEKSRTDTMMVLSWNKSEGQMRVVSLMRDIYAEIPGYKSYKLNTAYYLGGVQTAKDTISGMFGIPIHHYAIVDFENFESVVDLAFPSGVEIDVKKEMSKRIGVTLTPGTQRLNGQELLGYARFRADDEGDFGRVRRQQEVITALKQEVMNPAVMMKLPKVLGSISHYIETDLTEKDGIMRLMPLLFSGGIEIDTMTIPVEGSYSFTSYQHAGSVIEIDLEQNREAIHEFLNMSHAN